jgi:hypothetical protein
MTKLAARSRLLDVAHARHQMFLAPPMAGPRRRRAKSLKIQAHELAAAAVEPRPQQQSARWRNGLRELTQFGLFSSLFALLLRRASCAASRSARKRLHIQFVSAINHLLAAAAATDWGPQHRAQVQALLGPRARRQRPVRLERGPEKKRLQLASIARRLRRLFSAPRHQRLFVPGRRRTSALSFGTAKISTGANGRPPRRGASKQH